MPTDPRFWSEVFLQTITLFVLLVGWAGTLVPVFPGLFVMWLAAAFYAFTQNAADRMSPFTWILFGAMTMLMVIGGVIDNIIISRKMRGRSTPWSSILLALAAGIVGSLVLTPLAGLAASPLTLFVVETVRLRNRRLGFASARAYMIAWGWSFAAVFSVGALMLVLWLVLAFGPW